MGAGCLGLHSPWSFSQVHFGDTDPKGMSRAKTWHQSFSTTSHWKIAGYCWKGPKKVTPPPAPYPSDGPRPVTCLTTRNNYSYSSRKPQKINPLLSSACASLSHCHTASPWCCASYHHEHLSHVSKHGQTIPGRASQALKHSDAIVKAKRSMPANMSLGSS